MKVIGLTGGIGSGKSTVLAFLKKLGATVYIADIEAKKLMNTNALLKKQISSLFGELAYVNNELNRSFISSIVFKDKNKLDSLNALVHPKVQEDFKKFIKNSTAEVVIYEAAILFESGSHKLCDYVISVIASYEDRIKRIVKRDGLSEAQILDRIKHQISDDLRIKNAHFVIRNNGLEHTKMQAKTVCDLILELS